MCLDIKGTNWRTGSKLESLHRQGSLIAVLLLEMLTELFRVVCGRQEQHCLPLCQNWTKSLNVGVPSDKFSCRVPPAWGVPGGVTNHRAPLWASCGSTGHLLLQTGGRGVRPTAPGPRQPAGLQGAMARICTSTTEHFTRNLSRTTIL